MLTTREERVAFRNKSNKTEITVTLRKVITELNDGLLPAITQETKISIFLSNNRVLVLSSEDELHDLRDVLNLTAGGIARWEWRER